MHSKVLTTNSITLPNIIGKYPMIPFDLNTLEGLTDDIKVIASELLRGIKHSGGIAYMTVHGKVLKANETLRRDGKHTDGNFEPHPSAWDGGGGNGWKVGEDDPVLDSELHQRAYLNECGGIIMASNYESSKGYVGEYEGTPANGGDCTHINTDDGFMLKANTVYYGNNHFIHESLAVTEDVHRVLVRITMPENHVYPIN